LDAKRAAPVANTSSLVLLLFFYASAEYLHEYLHSHNHGDTNTSCLTIGDRAVPVPLGSSFVRTWSMTICKSSGEPLWRYTTIKISENTHFSNTRDDVILCIDIIENTQLFLVTSRR
jgi:hypothetical protein